MNVIALFDFDGTITKKDSLVDFIQFVIGKPKYFIGIFFLSLMLITYKLKMISNHEAKEKLITYFFKGWDLDCFQKLANLYSSEMLYKIINEEAIKKIKWHQQKGHEIVVVSASVENWLKNWCIFNNLELISTKLEINNGKLSGKFATRNCFGIEKVKRIKEKYNLENFDFIYAYGDSIGDKQMLELANKSYYRCFN
jgi:phosphatidylglycerophosphatase C